MTTIEVSREEFRRQWPKIKAGIIIDFVTALKRRCPVDSGKLRNSIQFDVSGDKAVVSMEGYAIYVEFGTPPHIIRPVNAKALHWKAGGKDVFAKVVRHPGTRPNPFIRTTIRNDLPTIIKDNFVRRLG